MSEVKIHLVPIEKPEEINFILGQTHFIKTVEDLYETIIQTIPNAQFGIAFCEASGSCKIRSDGTNKEMISLAIENATRMAAGHSFIVFMKDFFPLNILNSIKNIPEVCSIFCATANPTKVVIGESTFGNKKGRGILGVIDGYIPTGVENSEEIEWRKSFLRTIGYKR